MTRRARIVTIGVLAAVLLVLVMLFPRALAFAELAARSLRHLWWLVLIIALGVWLVWGVGRGPKR